LKVTETDQVWMHERLKCCFNKIFNFISGFRDRITQGPLTYLLIVCAALLSSFLNLKYELVAFELV
jgi:hypothetical protein